MPPKGFDELSSSRGIQHNSEGNISVPNLHDNKIALQVGEMFVNCGLGDLKSWFAYSVA